MFGQNFVTQCRLGCMGASAGAGLLAVIVLSSQANFFAALLVGIALAVLMAQVLIQLFCWDDEEDDDEEEDATTPTEVVTDSPAAAMAAAGAGAASAGGAATAKPSQAVKTGTLLKGEQEIAESKGSWTYTKEDDATQAATKKPADLDSMADSSNLFASEAADAEAGAQVMPDFHKDGGDDDETEGTQPEGLSAARHGKPDNLKEIKGVGPKLETMLNELGFYHFDQIANWSPAEIAWVDANLKGFKGRATRDDWIAQAKVLASGGDTEFSKRVDKGDVY